jgi:hypothetical protein
MNKAFGSTLLGMFLVIAMGSSVTGCGQTTAQNEAGEQPVVAKTTPLTEEEAKAYTEHTMAYRAEEQRLHKELEACSDLELQRKAATRLNFLRKKAQKWEIDGPGYTAAAWYRKQIEGKSLEQIVQEAQAEPETLETPPSQPPSREVLEGPVAKSYFAAKAAADEEQKVMERMSSENEKYNQEIAIPVIRRRADATTPEAKDAAEVEYAKMMAIWNDRTANLNAQIEKTLAAQAKAREEEAKFRKLVPH